MTSTNPLSAARDQQWGVDDQGGLPLIESFLVPGQEYDFDKVSNRRLTRATNIDCNVEYRLYIRSIILYYGLFTAYFLRLKQFFMLFVLIAMESIRSRISDTVDLHARADAKSECLPL